MAGILLRMEGLSQKFLIALVFLPCAGALAIIWLFGGGFLLNVHVKMPSQPAKASVIWMHGLGADSADMVSLVEQLPLAEPIRHVFMDAPIRPITLNNAMPMRAWYDIFGMALTDREDKEGIVSSAAAIHTVMEAEITAGCLPEHLFLAGFSQGGAMALYTGLHTPMRLGGIIALSAYLPMAMASKVQLDVHTPMFIASGQYDPLVLPAWTKSSAMYLRQKGFQSLVCPDYPMEHTICAEEVKDLATWLTAQVSANTCH